MLIKVTDIAVHDRQRKDLGDVDSLANSIHEYGIIQPIVLEMPETVQGREYRLVVGERRLEAIKRLGWAQLEHGKHFIFVDEANRNELRRSAVELEENLQRKELSWQEQVEAKQKLLELMQKTYGVAAVGARTRAEKSGAVHQGFGVNKLAAMLGESAAQTSKDLHLARIMKVIPSLKADLTKGAALRRAQILLSITTMSGGVNPQGGVAPGAKVDFLWTLYEGDFQSNCQNVADESVDLIYIDLPFGIDLPKLRRHGISGLISYTDPMSEIVSLLPDIAKQSYRVIKSDRFAVFWFNWRYYSELLNALQNAGFKVDPVPFAWYKHTNASQNPLFRYGIAYGVAMIARKGVPTFIHPGKPNLIEISNVPPNERLHIAEQPVELVEKFINDMIISGATVVDFFAGSGTTGVAAIKNNCKVILFERDKLCCESIKARLTNVSLPTSKTH